jgi:transcriptional regulator with XRE-family HTH domain
MDESSQHRDPAELPLAFPGQLRYLRIRAGLSQNRLARLSGIDPAYVNRMEAANDANPLVPRSAVLERVSLALELSSSQRDRLYVAAGRCPPTLARLGRWDTALGLVAELLADPTLHHDDRAEFRQVLEVLIDRWRRSGRSHGR